MEAQHIEAQAWTNLNGPGCPYKHRMSLDDSEVSNVLCEWKPKVIYISAVINAVGMCVP